MRTGDLLAALLLAHTELRPGRLAEAVEHALASVQGILQATVKAAGSASQSKERTSEVRKTGSTGPGSVLQLLPPSACITLPGWSCRRSACETAGCAQVCRARELRLIPNQHLLVEPDVQLHAEAISA